MAKVKPNRNRAARPRKPAAAKSFIPQVHVRMYLQGLGDCFLLRFEHQEGEFFDILIDCGIYKASPDAGQIMNEVVDHIVATTRTKDAPNGRLDVLVATHEHWDHISGFAQALPKFEKMQIDRVWQAWTEDPKDPLAARLRHEYEGVKTKLVKLMADARGSLGAHEKRLDSAYNIMGFFGVDKEGTSDDAYQNIKKLMASKNPRYLLPGKVLNLGTPNVKVFVLGPPADERTLRKQDISKADAYQKQRQHLAFFDGVNAMLAALSASFSGDEAKADDMDRPFDEHLRILRQDAFESEYFQSVYSFDDGDPERFRAIDDLAFDAFGSLALRMDNYTNNTSLVLAFQLANGSVLLFPGDAQGGNWKSWADPEKPLAFKSRKTDAHKLLAATVLYKVGHHGSHNATPRTYGLELMTHPDLRAFVPVDHAIAQQAGYGEMPLNSMLTALLLRANKRVVRSDETDSPVDRFRFSDEKLSIRVTKDGKAFKRPMYCETSFELQ